ncbi:MAG: fibrobacter succinogenes major paralogous domain-containing protein, partial [Mediterranea sp.]|nr:fibrobacter succinogenes major paralogous domain-containing protein [Mediterranea sp.]
FTTADGEEKVYGLPNTVTFNAGYSYSFTFVLNAATKVVDGMTNCYIVAPGAEVTFPVSRAYTYENKAFTTTLHTDGEYTGAFTAAIVWADALVINGTPSVSGSGNTAEVTVKTNASVTGNAVVKIFRSDNGETVWSYHIWVTDYTGAETFTNTKNTNNKSSPDGYFVFMDRNLGATAAGLTAAARGLFYQWGRKDPFPATLAPGATQPGGGSFTAVETDATVGTVANTIKNPSVFYTADSYSSSESDWLYASRDSTLWGHSYNGGTKTIYDPCPSGWRVPVNYGMSTATGPWYRMLSTGSGFSSGYNWGTNALYPATGYRYRSSGNVVNVGITGNYWSASPFDSINDFASFMNFESTITNSQNGALRAYGYPVRCVQE